MLDRNPVKVAAVIYDAGFRSIDGELYSAVITFSDLEVLFVTLDLDVLYGGISQCLIELTLRRHKSSRCFFCKYRDTVAGENRQ